MGDIFVGGVLGGYGEGGFVEKAEIRQWLGEKALFAGVHRSTANATPDSPRRCSFVAGLGGG